MLGGLGVLDQGADSTLRDPEVQVLLLLLLLFFPSHIGTGFSDKSVFATFYLGGAFTLPQGRKEVPNIIFSLYAKCMVCRNGIQTHTPARSIRTCGTRPCQGTGNARLEKSDCIEVAHKDDASKETKREKTHIPIRAKGKYS